MASDYEAIRKENLLDYGRKVDRVGRLVANLYGDSDHFIFELLQNAEDALQRHDGDPNSRTIRFDLSAHSLRVSHYGKPFDEDDVKGICEIGEGTKEEDLSQIGRFGIGFKSVYGFTDRPQIHSGNEDFGIDKFVWPSAQPIIERDPDQTIFVMPLRDVSKNRPAIAEGLRRINLRTLLFLREIDTVEWSVSGGESGMYLQQVEELTEHVRRVTLIGESTCHDDTEQDWLVFSKPMRGDGDLVAGHVEVAFFLKDGRIAPRFPSPLVVFFPTAVETNLGLLVQGPYRTTPSRDNVPKSDPWNQACVEHTGELVVEALVWLRGRDMLDVDVLRCLPLDRSKFGDGSMFAPIYERTKAAFMAHRLLPASGGGFAASTEVKVARSGDLRGLFTPAMLGVVFDEDAPRHWLSADITDRSAPELTRYLRDVLDVDEVRPLNVIRRLTAEFLERQSNEWVCSLYEFMNGQKDLHWQARQEWPLVRLATGQHVVAHRDDVVQAYLPGAGKTSFPTVHAESCSTDNARAFLEAIGLSLPDPVDDVVRNVLPKYERDSSAFITKADYADDVGRVIDAFQTDSTARRKQLMDSVRRTYLVFAVDHSTHTKERSKPGLVYFRTDRLASLFDGVEGVLFVDQDYECLHGEKVRSMLEACGASRFLRSEEVGCALSESELRDIRVRAGLEAHTWGETSDRSLGGIEQLLNHMASLPAAERRVRAATLWEALVDVAGRTRRAFVGTYEWRYYRQSKTAEFDSALVRKLNDTAWVPSGDGEFRSPSEVSFRTLGWRADPFLQSKVRFRPAEIDLLAEKVDIEAEVLYLLKEHGLTNVGVVRDRLGLVEDFENEEGDETRSGKAVEDAVAASVGATRTPSIDDRDSEDEGAPNDGALSGYCESGEARAGRARTTDPVATKASGSSVRQPSITTFHSYVAVGPDDDDGVARLDREQRMALEEAAIELILSREPNWERTPPNNEGFDLVQVADGRECAWCEVKAMKGSLLDRPVGMSRAQFKYAQERGSAYWLYIVELAGGEDARIVRIQSPAGRAKTFTFDRGWLDVAEID